MSFIGPALPPHLMHLLRQGEEDEDSEEKQADAPTEDIPVIGPVLPTNLQRQESGEVDDDKEDTDLYGPALPPGFQANQPRIIGPTLPPGVTLGQLEENEEEDDEVVGPMPVPPGEDQADYLQRQFESRADRMRNKLAEEGKEKPAARESWMVELPKDRSGLLGLEARSFRRKAGPDRSADTSEWTDTPEDKLRKAQGLPKAGSSSNSAAELEAIALMERDKAMAKRAAKHASKRPSDSLLDMHQKELKKKKQEEEKEEKPKRQMFDRDRDLQVNRFDEAQKKAVYNKAKLLNDRFSSGGQKYL